MGVLENSVRVLLKSSEVEVSPTSGGLISKSVGLLDNRFGNEESTTNIEFVSHPDGDIILDGESVFYYDNIRLDVIFYEQMSALLKVTRGSDVDIIKKISPQKNGLIDLLPRKKDSKERINKEERKVVRDIIRGLDNGINALIKANYR